MRKMTVGVLSLFLVGCAAGKIEMTRPASPQAGANVKIVAKGRDAVWNAAVPNLGKQFFVINTIDKSSGLINISYSGDPEKYIDCGEFSSHVKSAAGERTYRFPGASPNENYEAMINNNLFRINRRMSVEGRMNLVFEEVSPGETRISANTRYVVNRQVQILNMQGQTANRTDTISFNSGAGASFPRANDGQAIECVAKGTLEQEVLSLVR